MVKECIGALVGLTLTHSAFACCVLSTVAVRGLKRARGDSFIDWKGMESGSVRAADAPRPKAARHKLKHYLCGVGCSVPST
jgi:hypothetical protein